MNAALADRATSGKMQERPRMKRLHMLLLLGAAMLLSIAPITARPLEDADAAYDRGDYAIAVELYRPLAKQGDADAQFYLGFMYSQGWGVPRNYAEAVNWYRLAANQGNAPAQTALGSMYHDGLGVPQDYAEALKWLRLAADQGYDGAQDILGMLYRAGRGVPQNYVLAHMWFNLAAAQGDQFALANIEEIAKLMTPAQIAAAQKLAREWRPQR